MTKYNIYLSPPSQNGTEADELLKSLESNWLAPVGPHLDKFELNLSNSHSNKNVLAVNSGTAAIHLALQLCGVGIGDSVIVASHTHNATVNPIIYQGAQPVFVDSENDTWNMSPEFLEEAILDSKRKSKSIKAIIVVHLYGVPAKMDQILAIASKYQIPIIEDAAEALGGTFDSKPLGTLGTYGILSFNGNKIITTSGGGALICSSANERERALFLATQARDKALHFEHTEIGYNYRMSNVLAALGIAQLSDLKQRVLNKRAIFKSYSEVFQKINEVEGANTITSTNDQQAAYGNRWLSTFLIKPIRNITNSSWRKILEEYRIESRPVWKPMHLQPIFKNYPFYGDHTSDRIFEQGICLPSGNDLTPNQIEEITGLISSLYIK